MSHARRVTLYAIAIWLIATSASATSYTWNGTTGNWSDSSSWTPNGVPGAADSATIGSGNPVINVNVTVNTVTMNNGILTGSGSLTVSTFNWNGGTLTGTGATTIPSGGVLTVGGGLNVPLDGRPLTNNGTINFTSGTSLNMQNGAALTNSGTIDFKIDAGIVAGAGSSSVVNNGTIRKTAAGGAGSSGVSVPLTANSGSQVLVSVGTLYVYSSTSTGASFDVAAGANLIFEAGTHAFDGASAITGAGTVIFSHGTSTVDGLYRVTGATHHFFDAITTMWAPDSFGSFWMSSGTLTLQNAEPIPVPSFRFDGGVISGPGSIELTGPTMTWSGGTLAASSTLTIPSTSTVTWSGGDLGGGYINNAGILAITSFVAIGSDATITNTATGIIDFQGNVYLSVYTAVGTTSVARTAVSLQTLPTVIPGHIM